MNDNERDRGRAPFAAAEPDEGLSEADLATLGAFVDDALEAGDDTALRARLADDPLAAGRVAAYAAQKAALQALCHAGDPGPVSCLVLRPCRPWWWRAGTAAAWCVTGAGVALAASAFVPRVASGDAGTASVQRADEPHAFAQHADIAYAVYAPEQRHPVEVGAADEAHLVTWLSKRLGAPLSVPSLQAYGYALVGGRLLPDTSGPAAQFMYENEAGARLTLYVVPSGVERGAVQLLRDGNRRTFYWATGHMGYALSGPLAETRLRTIAYDVCGALGGQRSQW